MDRDAADVEILEQCPEEILCLITFSRRMSERNDDGIVELGAGDPGVLRFAVGDDNWRQAEPCGEQNHLHGPSFGTPDLQPVSAEDDRAAAPSRGRTRNGARALPGYGVDPGDKVRVELGLPMVDEQLTQEVVLSW